MKQWHQAAILFCILLGQAAQGRTTLKRFSISFDSGRTYVVANLVGTRSANGVVNVKIVAEDGALMDTTYYLNNDEATLGFVCQLLGKSSGVPARLALAGSNKVRYEPATKSFKRKVDGETSEYVLSVRCPEKSP